jgi:hypothetical protein
MQPMPKKEPWRPSFGEVVAVGALVAAAVMWLKPPNWEWGLPITAILVALVIFTAIRHQSHPIRRAIVAVIAITVLVWAAAEPIWKSLRVDYPNMAFQSPITFNTSAAPLQVPSIDPPDMPPLNLPGPPLSRWGNIMFICPTPPSIDPKKRDEVIEQIKRNADIYGKALGLDLVFNEIPYGVRFDVTARDTQGQTRMQMAERYTVQMEAAANGILVDVTLYWIGAYAILSEFTLERDSQMAKLWASQMEQLGFAAGTCRML